METLNTSTSYLVDGIVEVRHTPQVEDLLDILLKQMEIEANKADKRKGVK